MGFGELPLKICVFGLWHLGCVTAACLADAGFEVTGLDLDPKIIAALKIGRAPLYEPGLIDLIQKGIASGNLSFTENIEEALKDQNLIWVTFDTPVDEDDHADTDFVINAIKKLFFALAPGALVLISSQLPVGSTRIIEEAYASSEFQNNVHFAYSPENLRLGKAIFTFTHPDRIVAGIRNASDKTLLGTVLSPFTQQIEWMSVESAEMTKHALNGFLAASVAYINEIATLCESTGADAKEVERGLKSEIRIGPKAYLNPGSAFSGGTLARDITFLANLGKYFQIPTHLVTGVKNSNDSHKNWPRERLKQNLGNLKGKVIAVWGLTYKPGTDTLRRSSSVELCTWLIEQEAIVQAYDPLVQLLPPSLSSYIHLFPDAASALAKADALVIGTDCPEFKSIQPEILKGNMKSPVIVDANRFLGDLFEGLPGICYITVGKGSVNKL